MKEKVRPIYSELKGYLEVAPNDHFVFDEMALSMTNQFNGAIDELNSVTSNNYDKFKINTRNTEWNRIYRTVFESLDYRNKLSGLISRLQGEFFSEEQTPSNQPNTIINTNQTQSQSQSLAVVLELQEKILSEIPKHKEGSKERTFLEKLKSSLPTITNVTGILANALKIGAELELGPTAIHKLLGL